MTIGKRVIYSGRVQGVGFRYTVQRLAMSFVVTGFVRNLPDGTVELVAEGTVEEVDRFLAAVAGRMAAYIENATESTREPEGIHRFQIR